jgi:branched-chain amino acid aminotransferase
MNEIVYLNGRLISRSQARISALDYGFLYGYALFETMRAYGGRVFRLDSHLNRLAQSAKVLGISIEVLELKGAVMDTIQANKLSEARIRLTVSIGEGEMTPNPNTCKKPTVLILAEKYQPYLEKVYRMGFRAVVSNIRRNSQSPLSRLKSTSYLESILARQEAREAGVDEAICLNEKGFLAEGSMSNIFLVTDGVLKTPGLESGILPGITRQSVLELAFEMGVTSRECDIRLDELFQSQEVFLTSSLIEVMPLAEIEGKLIGSGKQGSITKRLMAAYKKLVLNEEKVV